jgi:Mg-chelatase subunit ChlD
MRRRGVQFAAALVVLLLAAGPGRAYKLIGAQPADGTYCAGALLDCDDVGPFTRWFQPIVPFWVHEDAAAEATGSTITQAQIIAAAQAAYQQWEDVPTSFLKFSYQGETNARLAADGVNALVMYNPGLDTSSCTSSMGAPSGLLAMTILTEDLPTGEIVDVDVVFDSADLWTVNTDCTQFDFQSVVTHEYGHSVGLHHSEVSGGVTVRPTMAGGYFCDAGTASGRTIEPDDAAGLTCLYPENPALILVDETGSMSIDSRMADAKASANAFITDFADNTMSVASFAESAACSPPRDGYNLREDWTMLVGPLQAAVNATSACGATPMWESICCGIGKSIEQDPANLLVITDTEENVSGGSCSAECPVGFCGCVNVNDALSTAAGTNTTVYVIDVTLYSGLSLAATAANEEPVGTCSDTGQRCLRDEDCPEGGYCIFPPDCNQQFPTPEGQELYGLAQQSGGLYCAAYDPEDLKKARLAVERHMMEKGKAKQNPPRCLPDAPHQLADDIQSYDAAGNPNSPFLDEGVVLDGLITVRPDTFDEFVTYLEDCSGGIKLLDRTPPALKAGSRVQVEGRVSVDEGGEIQVQPAEIILLGDGVLPPRPVVDPDVAQDFEQIGALMIVRGFAENDVQQDRFELVSDLALQNPFRVTVFLHPNAGIDPDLIRRGSAYEITGILSRRGGSNELMPRSNGDIVQTFAQNPVSLPGEPRIRRVGYSPATGQLQVDYTPACAASNHTIYYGPLQQVAGYGYSGAACALGTSGSASFAPGALASAFFLVVGENGLDEGSYGRRSSGTERPEDLGTQVCDRPQSLGASCR